MFIYSKTSTSKLFHIEQCPNVKFIKEEHIGYFHSASEAIQSGYHLCPSCSALGKMYHAEKQSIDSFCQKMKFICRWENGHIYIETSIESWLIVYSPHMRKYAIYHKNNTCHKPFSNKTPYEIIPGYHHQAWNFHSILDTLESIYDHQAVYLDQQDLPKKVKHHVNVALRKKMPKKKKSKAKEKRKTKYHNEQQNLKNVLNLIEHL